MGIEYPPNWDDIRKTAYLRDDYTCQNCKLEGSPHGDTKLHAHHVVPKSRGGTHDLENLVTLCEECHLAVHNSGKMAPSATARKDSSITISYDEFIELLGPTPEDADLEKANELVDRISEVVDDVWRYTPSLFPTEPVIPNQTRVGAFSTYRAEKRYKELSAEWKEELR
ncbi:HNH endonuclease [Halorussus ruber]|uniref:HNH endonuclease n=1 Tax=Halorussus ruber TaxID=1126238 RepID=UPI0010923701|nr:HNH endonuclease [Halorussus ruber]